MLIRYQLVQKTPDGLRSVTNWNEIDKLFNGELESCLYRFIEKVRDRMIEIHGYEEWTYQIEFAGIEYTNGYWVVLCRFNGSDEQRLATRTYLHNTNANYKKITLRLV